MFIVVPRAPFLRRLLVYSSKLHNQRAFNIEDPCSINCSTMVPHPDSTGAHNEYTAGIIIIGDEILKGQVQDVNTYFLCKRLREMGVTVSKVSMVSDSLEDIATEVRDFSKRFRFVITTGGIGPTHDDRTFEAVGKAFDVPLALHPDVAKFCEEWYGSTDRSLPVFKLAMIPTNAKLNYGRNPETGEIVRFPLVQVHNVYIFPGIPQLLVNAMNRLGKKLFANPSFSRYEASLYVNVDEPSAAPVLNQAVAKFPDVEFGSYPVLFNSYYRVQFTMEGKSEERIKQAETFLKDSFPDKIVSYDPYPTVDAWEKHQALLASSKTSEGLKNFLKHAIEVLEKTYNDYRNCNR
ncbi:unnamed protein product [Cyprideis torosa]|uniref:Uncharacterized protein n=1 Tax=Cyprideis torosa TaxID=163714 RepID=A0A7R8W9Q6_9CRUS|nr:unnamed protein product [Cyprideis torosa]CAG0884661.1 unnamed protein product [Cyprideis torosa]